MSEEKLCPYCHTDIDGYTQKLHRTGDGKDYIWHHHPINGGWCLHVTGKYRTYTTVKIRFCPICGRELKDG